MSRASIIAVHILFASLIFNEARAKTRAHQTLQSAPQVDVLSVLNEALAVALAEKDRPVRVNGILEILLTVDQLAPSRVDEPLGEILVEIDKMKGKTSWGDVFRFSLAGGYIPSVLSGGITSDEAAYSRGGLVELATQRVQQKAIVSLKAVSLLSTRDPVAAMELARSIADDTARALALENAIGASAEAETGNVIPLIQKIADTPLGKKPSPMVLSMLSKLAAPFDELLANELLDEGFTHLETKKQGLAAVRLHSLAQRLQPSEFYERVRALSMRGDKEYKRVLRELTFELIKDAPEAAWRTLLLWDNDDEELYRARGEALRRLSDVLPQGYQEDVKTYAIDFLSVIHQNHDPRF